MKYIKKIIVVKNQKMNIKIQTKEKMENAKNIIKMVN